MKVLVVGASRGTGAQVVAELAGRGHEVTGFARTRPEVPVAGVRYVAGDVSDAGAVAKAMVGQEAVVVTLGIPDNPFRVRLTRRASSALDVRSAGTAHVLAAMADLGVRRLLVQTTYGIGETYRELPLALKLFFTLGIRPQVRDHELQEAAVRASGTDWTIVRPVVLHDGDEPEPAVVDTADRAVSMRVSRRQVARVHADLLEQEAHVHTAVTVAA